MNFFKTGILGILSFAMFSVCMANETKNGSIFALYLKRDFWDGIPIKIVYNVKTDSTGALEEHAAWAKNTKENILKYYGMESPIEERNAEFVSYQDRSKLEEFDQAGELISLTSHSGNESLTFKKGDFAWYDKEGYKYKKLSILDMFTQIPQQQSKVSHPAYGASIADILENGKNPRLEESDGKIKITYKIESPFGFYVLEEFVFTKGDLVYLPVSVTHKIFWKIAEGEYLEADKNLYRLEFSDYKKIGGLAEFFPGKIKIVTANIKNSSEFKGDEAKIGDLQISEIIEYTIKEVSLIPSDQLEDAFKVVLANGTKLTTAGEDSEIFIVGDGLKQLRKEEK